MIELPCVVCGKKINNPIVGKDTCDNVKCKKEYNRFLNRTNYVKWRTKHKPNWEDKYKGKTICQDINQRGISPGKIRVGD